MPLCHIPSHIYMFCRPVDTLTPLANELKLQIDTRFKRGQMKELAEYILQLPTTNISVVCWEHHRLETIATNLGVEKGAMPVDLIHFRGPSYDNQWSIFYDEAKGGGISIVEQRQFCTNGGSTNLVVLHWLYSTVALGIFIVVASMLAKCVMPMCLQKKAEERRHCILARDSEAGADEPLMDDTNL